MSAASMKQAHAYAVHCFMRNSMGHFMYGLQGREELSKMYFSGPMASDHLLKATYLHGRHDMHGKNAWHFLCILRDNKYGQDLKV